jgi:hypothetical protein
MADKTRQGIPKEVEERIQALIKRVLAMLMREERGLSSVLQIERPKGGSFGALRNSGQEPIMKPSTIGVTLCVKLSGSSFLLWLIPIAV